jgi:hypothetical protein
MGTLLYASGALSGYHERVGLLIMGGTTGTAGRTSRAFETVLTPGESEVSILYNQPRLRVALLWLF